MRLLRSTKPDIDKDKNGEYEQELELVEVALMHCNLGNNKYQQASKVLFLFVFIKQLIQLITILPHSLKMLELLT